jgi:Na+/phosphate symporter
MAAYFHLAFNTAIALAFILPLDRLAAFLTRLLPEKKAAGPGLRSARDAAYGRNGRDHVKATYHCASWQ